MARIAFIACNKRADLYDRDPSFVYRCMNLAYGVKKHGHEVWCGHLKQFAWHLAWDVVVFHRPRSAWRLNLLMYWLRRRGVRVLADVDDLIMNPELARFSPGVMNGLVSLSKTQKLFRKHYKALDAVSGISVSTSPLAAQVHALWPDMPMVVVPNALHHEWLHRKPAEQGGAAPVLAYMSGTRSHDRDFAMITPVLERVLRRHPHAQLKLTGPLNISLNARSGQVIQQEKLLFKDYYRCFDDVTVNLAPLEQSPFTQCKSALKVIEAAWWNIPTICSELPDAERLNGAGALCAHTADDFEEHLENVLIIAKDNNNKYDKILRDRIQPLADISSTSRIWLNFALTISV